jgi:hypothetical protein
MEMLTSPEQRFDQGSTIQDCGLPSPMTALQTTGMSTNKEELIMNTCKSVEHRGANGSAPKTACSINGRSRCRTTCEPAVPAKVRHRASLCAGGAGGSTSKEQAGPATLSTDPPRALALFQTTSGFNVTQRVLEWLWLASEQDGLAFETVYAALSGDNLTLADMSEVCGMLGQAGVNLVEACKLDPAPSVAGTEAKESVHLELQITHFSEPREAAAVLKRMEDEDREIRRIVCSFGFAAREHITRAEKLLMHPSEAAFQHLVAESETRSHKQYLKLLPNLAKRVRQLDAVAAKAYQKRREALGHPNGPKRRAEISKIDGVLQKSLGLFHYRLKVIREIAETAQHFAAEFQASQQAFHQARRSCASVCQMSPVDVDLQTLESMEEFVRMPCEVFLGNCARLEAAEKRFQQARCELIQGHLHMVASVAATCSNRDIILPRLIREGISGLIQAVEEFGYGHERKFSTYAACGIRHSIRDALAAKQNIAPLNPPQDCLIGAHNKGRDYVFDKPK